MLGRKNLTMWFVFLDFFLKVVHNVLQSTGPGGAGPASLHWGMLQRLGGSRTNCWMHIHRSGCFAGSSPTPALLARDCLDCPP